MNTPGIRQTWVVSSVLVNMFGQGMVISFPTSLMPALQDPKSSIKADLNTATWLSSSMGMAIFLGFLMSSVLIDIIGRKKSHLVATLPGFIGWLLIYFASDVPQIMLGRILGGTCAGASVSLGAIVIGEYTTPKYRGVFLNLKTASVCLGGMFVHIVSFYISWRNIALVAVAPCILSLFINCTWPESPAWLISKQQYGRSEEVFYWLRGKSEKSTKEIENTVNAHMNRFSTLNQNFTVHQKVVEFFKKFTQSDFLNPLNIIVVTTVLLETSGRHAFPAYAMQIIDEITDQKSHSFYYTLGIDIIITISAVSSSILVKVMNRRSLLFYTGFAAVVVLATACTYLYLVSIELVSKDRSWIPMTLFVFYFILTNLGCTPIPLALLGEVFPLAHRAIGSAVSGICMSICLVSILHLTPIMLVNFKLHGTFAIFGSIMTLSLVILYFTLPETKDKTLQEIEQYFNYKKYSKDKFSDEDVKLKILESRQ